MSFDLWTLMANELLYSIKYGSGNYLKVMYALNPLLREYAKRWTHHFSYKCVAGS